MTTLLQARCLCLTFPAAKWNSQLGEDPSAQPRVNPAAGDARRPQTASDREPCRGQRLLIKELLLTPCLPWTAQGSRQAPAPNCGARVVSSLPN